MAAVTNSANAEARQMAIISRAAVPEAAQAARGEAGNLATFFATFITQENIMNTLKTIIAVLVSAIVAGSAFAGNGGPGNGQGSGGTPTPLVSSPVPNPSAILSEAAFAALRLMREEEKLAHDVYLYLGAQWNSRIFNNIAASEQTHMDQVLTFLQAYNLPDPASAMTGVFNDASLQQLYNLLIAEGSKSLLNAFQVGALIEEVDIRDLRSAITASTDSALDQMYINLMSASYNHLNAFVGQIAQQGAHYNAQILDSVDMAEILSGNGAIPTPGAGGAFTVDTSTANGSMSGLWGHPSESGWGGTITQQYGKIFAAFYTYESDGAPVWYSVSDCPLNGSGCSGELYKVTGGVPLTSAWNSANIALTPVGNARFSFTDTNNGTVSFTVNGLSGSKQIARFIFAAPPAAGSTDR
jgi:hypothetical protein